LAGGTTVQTAADEGLRGAEDERIHAVCRAEQRCLITLDLDFIDVVRFPAIPPAGLVVLRPPRRTSQAVLLGLLEQMLSLVGREPLAGQIWILEVGRVRIRDQQRT
jgi:predicted nuclease of predicted toxin-antitoxin system